MGLLSGRSIVNAARHAAKEGNFEPVNAPIHRLQELERTAKEKLDKLRNAEINHAKVLVRNRYY